MSERKISRVDKTKSKIRVHIVEENDRTHYWYSFTNENRKPDELIINKMFERITKYFGTTRVITFYANPNAGYSGRILRKYIYGTVV